MQIVYSQEQHLTWHSQLSYFTDIFNGRKRATFNLLRRIISFIQMMTAGMSFANICGRLVFFIEHTDY